MFRIEGLNHHQSGGEIADADGACTPPCRREVLKKVEFGDVSYRVVLSAVRRQGVGREDGGIQAAVIQHEMLLMQSFSAAGRQSIL